MTLTLTDGRTDGRMDGRTDEWTDRQTQKSKISIPYYANRTLLLVYTLYGNNLPCRCFCENITESTDPPTYYSRPQALLTLPAEEQDQLDSMLGIQSSSSAALQPAVSSYGSLFVGSLCLQLCDRLPADIAASLDAAKEKDISKG